MYNPFTEIAAIFNKKIYLFERLFQPLRTSGFLVFFEVFVRVRICICKTLSALPIKISRWIVLLHDFAGYNLLRFLFVSNAYHLALNSGFPLSNNKNSTEALFWDFFFFLFNWNIFPQSSGMNTSQFENKSQYDITFCHHQSFAMQIEMPTGLQRVQGLPAHGACTNNERFTMWVISTFRKRPITNQSIKGYG